MEYGCGNGTGDAETGRAFSDLRPNLRKSRPPLSPEWRARAVLDKCVRL